MYARGGEEVQETKIQAHPILSRSSEMALPTHGLHLSPKIQRREEDESGQPCTDGSGGWTAQPILSLRGVTKSGIASVRSKMQGPLEVGLAAPMTAPARAM